MPNPSTLAMEEQWKKEEADKSALEKAYQSGKKKGDATTLDPNKLDSELVEHTLNQLIQPNIAPIDILKLGHIAGTFIQEVPTTILHALSYPITGRYGIAHGNALGFLIFPLCKIFNDSISYEISNFGYNVELKIIKRHPVEIIAEKILEACYNNKDYDSVKNLCLDCNLLMYKHLVGMQSLMDQQI